MADGVVTTATRAAARLVTRLAGRVRDHRAEHRARRDVPGHPHSGEVVWVWVPFEEDARRGKDRPVLVVGHRRDRLLALMLTTTDHDAPGRLRRQDQAWMDVGSGSWDRRRRPSEVRLDRLLVLDPRRIRREGGSLDPVLFHQVLTAARHHQRLH